MNSAFSRHSAARWLLAAVLLLAAGIASARNDRLLLPIEPALRSPGTRALLAGDIALRFGAASASANEAGFVTVHAVADPFGPPNGGGARVRRADEVVCLDAFRKALMDLQQRARTQGATAVVGIVGNYNNVVMDSPQVYECHIGHSRGVVDLKGVVSRGAQPVMAPPVPQYAPQQPVAAAPQAAQPAPAQPARIASGFAAIDDVDAIPYLSDRGRQHYRDWLAFPTPKAYAISATGYFFGAAGLRPQDSTLPTDPVERAVVGCERAARVQCKLYAVNRSVVWTK
ncbi:MAG: putative Dienelactone hydrolase [Ramlibacter sp.]|nr:putative Dienelactone hydrolase [Ramlibacter sp.]